MRHNAAHSQRVISEPEMSPQTTIVELDLDPDELVRLERIAANLGLSLEELVAAAVKEYLASAL